MTRPGESRFIIAILAVWVTGTLLLLARPVAGMMAGLALFAVCGMLCQTLSTGYVTAIAKEGRSSAVGLYVMFFYIGGSVGAFLPGLAWNAAGWTACVAMTLPRDTRRRRSPPWQ